MLSNEYFPYANVEMGTTLKQAVRDEYDFAVANEDILYDSAATVDTKTISLPGITTSTRYLGCLW